MAFPQGKLAYLGLQAGADFRASAGMQLLDRAFGELHPAAIARNAEHVNNAHGGLGRQQQESTAVRRLYAQFCGRRQEVERVFAVFAISRTEIVLGALFPHDRTLQKDWNRT